MADHRIKCVIVEDRALEQRTLQQWLESQGYHVVSCFENGKEFLEWLGEKNIDLLILDLIMPVQDGYSTFFDLVAMKNFPRTVVISMENSAGVIKKLLENGCMDFITRPTSREAFLDRIKKVLARPAPSHN